MLLARDTARRDRAFAVLWFGQFAAIAGLTVVVPLLPFYLAGFGLEAADVAWWTGIALAAPAVTQLITAPLWGMVGDRYGHKAMVVRAHAGLALAVGLMAFAETPGEFLACRLLQGACGGVVSATAAYASTVAAPQRRGRTLGGLFGATGAGSLVGPLLGSVLAGRFGFGALFGSVAVLLVIASGLALVLLPRSCGEAGSRENRRGGLRDAARSLLLERSGRSLLLAGLLGQAAIYALIVVFAQRVAGIAGSIAAATMWVGALQAATWAASLLGGPWWGRRNDRRPANAGFAIAAVCCGVAVALQALPASPELLLPLRLVQGFCFAAFAQSVLHVACDLAPRQARGTAVGFSSGCLDLGQVAGPFFGALAVTVLPPGGAFAAIGALLGCAAVLAVCGLRRSSPSAPVTVAAARKPELTEVGS
ncbi:MAG: MFS transporter [Actinophytocola sp.]|nr:MFS transporter [Actinophytocola sp.]